ncbi:MAG: cupin domain-containing protein [Candidatus Bipolaricaulota bacterium]
MPYFAMDDVPASEALPGVLRRAVSLDRVMLTHFAFAPGSQVPEHRHPEEQITIVTRGALRFTLEGVTRILHAGEGVCVPAGTLHGAAALSEPAEAYDAWSPPREDYRTSSAATPR